MYELVLRYFYEPSLCSLIPQMAYDYQDTELIKDIQFINDSYMYDIY